MIYSPWIQGGIAFFAALFIGTFIEYFIHRLMHYGKVLGRKHAEHHRDGWGQGWLGEFWDYFAGGLLIIWIGFLFSIPIGIGWASGCFLYACIAAYSHQLQHEHPELVFWMPRPVHHIHHAHKMWKHNFGITVDWWDRVFGTYQYVEWKPEKGSHSLKSYFQIKWY